MFGKAPLSMWPTSKVFSTRWYIHSYLPQRPRAQTPWSFPGLRPGVPYNANNSQPDIKWQSFCVAQSQMFTVYSFVSCWDFCCCHYFPCWFIIFLSLLYLAYIQWLKQPMCHLTVLCGWKPVSHPLGSVGSLFNSDTKLAGELGLILHVVEINILPILVQLLAKVKWMWLQDWLISCWL